MHSLFEQYFVLPSTTTLGGPMDQGKAIIGTPLPGFPPKENVVMSLAVDLGHMSTYSLAGSRDRVG